MDEAPRGGAARLWAGSGEGNRHAPRTTPSTPPSPCSTRPCSTARAGMLPWRRLPRPSMRPRSMRIRFDFTQKEPLEFRAHGLGCRGTESLRPVLPRHRSGAPPVARAGVGQWLGDEVLFDPHARASRSTRAISLCPTVSGGWAGAGWSPRRPNAGFWFGVQQACGPRPVWRRRCARVQPFAAPLAAGDTGSKRACGSFQRARPSPSRRSTP